MDDPWGSPWASTDAPSNALHVLNPPPKAFFGGASLTHSPGGLSPWADDDALGVWAKPDHDQSESSPWATGRDSPAFRTPQLKTKSSAIFDKESTGAWLGSPGLNPPLRSRTSSLFRQPSPDPWAADTPWLDATPRLPPPSADPTAGNLKPEHTPLSTPCPSPVIPSPSRQPEAEDDEGDAVVRPHDSPSRPSSTFSNDDNGRALERQDSPITSIDEDASVRPQKPSGKKVSGKIAVLVDKFDGLAKAASEEPVRPTSSRDLQPAAGDELKSDSDLATAALDDARQAVVGNKQLNGYSGVSSFDQPSSPIVSPGDKGENFGESRTETSRSPSVPVQQLIEKFGPISFNVNLDDLQTIFSNAPEDTSNGANLDGELPDRIISDSFTNVEQRRIWYRISRYGSMRKHNSGDDDNYPRVQWADSEVHAEIVKIVRRWKEEDSMSGRPTFGMGKRASGFNWDTGEGPIEMDKIFARKPTAAKNSSISTVTPRHSLELPHGQMVGKAGDQSLSMGSSLSQPRKSLLGPSDEVKIFGWSSTAPEPSSTVPLKSDESRGLHFIAPPPAVASKQLPQEPLPQNQHSDLSKDDGEDDGDDDDEWGEMVVSPTFAKGPGLISNGFPDIGDPEPSSSKAGTTLPDNWGPASLQQNILGAEASVVTGKSGYTANIPGLEPAVESTSLLATEGESQEPKGQVSDPWAFADFSHFETPAPNHTQDQQPETPITNKATELPVSVSNKARTSPELATVILGPVQSSKKKEQEMSKAVEDIIRNLPDLSYMLQ